MRTPVGSSKSSARSLRHSSPAWLPSGVTLTSADDWPFATTPFETQTTTTSSTATPSDRTRMRTSLSNDATASVRPRCRTYVLIERRDRAVRPEGRTLRTTAARPSRPKPDPPYVGPGLQARPVRLPDLERA